MKSKILYLVRRTVSVIFNFNHSSLVKSSTAT
ncbi:hypothetical protein DFH84_000252 [Clostridium saccharobutylicum]|nr:hypothetical protein [Clostridium saccharobutylicum]MBA9008399.1 hypothetical protein [Clostridium saccharobutylicum]NOV63922.1 hypothetical protein [Clostridium saccharobutylicum]NOV83049.1 hypothetical protein [Clostridium saccharobutylicum]NOW08363.1 hypothetical protein [Clostridium saccharobutylicum]